MDEYHNPSLAHGKEYLLAHLDLRKSKDPMPESQGMAVVDAGWASQPWEAQDVVAAGHGYPSNNTNSGGNAAGHDGTADTYFDTQAGSGGVHAHAAMVGAGDPSVSAAGSSGSALVGGGSGLVAWIFDTPVGAVVDAGVTGEWSENKQEQVLLPGTQAWEQGEPGENVWHDAAASGTAPALMPGSPRDASESATTALAKEVQRLKDEQGRMRAEMQQEVDRRVDAKLRDMREEFEHILFRALKDPETARAVLQRAYPERAAMAGHSEGPAHESQPTSGQGVLGSSSCAFTTDKMGSPQHQPTASLLDMTVVVQAAQPCSTLLREQTPSFGAAPHDGHLDHRGGSDTRGHGGAIGVFGAAGSSSAHAHAAVVEAGGLTGRVGFSGGALGCDGSGHMAEGGHGIGDGNGHMAEGFGGGGGAGVDAGTTMGSVSPSPIVQAGQLPDPPACGQGENVRHGAGASGAAAAPVAGPGEGAAGMARADAGATVLEPAEEGREDLLLSRMLQPMTHRRMLMYVAPRAAKRPRLLDAGDAGDGQQQPAACGADLAAYPGFSMLAGSSGVHLGASPGAGGLVVPSAAAGDSGGMRGGGGSGCLAGGCDGGGGDSDADTMDMEWNELSPLSDASVSSEGPHCHFTAPRGYTYGDVLSD
eukprot:jgi/Mesvir1/24880/Mv22110-RA.1